MGKHQKTLKAMRPHPNPSNLRWADVESLFESYGAEIKERKRSKISVTLNGQTAYFHRPHPSDTADKGAIEIALALLRKAGIKEARDAD